MSYNDDDQKSRLPAWVCAEDARRRDTENITLFTPEEIEQGKLLFNKVQNAFIRSRTYMNYREGFIAVKVDKPKMADKLSPEFSQLEQYVTRMGYEVRKTKIALIYHIKKSA